MVKRLLIGAVVLGGFISLGAQNAGPALGSLIGGSSSVSGKASPGSAPISIFDLSFEQKTKIGQADSVGDDGSFSAGVRPPLVKGHQIVAIDKNGNAGNHAQVE